MISNAQDQTSKTFGFQWQKTDAWDSPEMRAFMHDWLIERYGDIEHADWWDSMGPGPLVVDAGCGGGLSAVELFGSRLNRVDYLGVDISPAYQVAQQRFSERGLKGRFIQADISKLDLPPASVSVILSEGVMHHTDSTERTLKHLSGLLRKGGRFLFYVYRKKAPIREFADDHIRGLLQKMSPEEAWDALYPLTKLGKALGELNLDVEVPESIPLLGIPAGKINVQRLFYWYIFKAFYRADMSVDEMNHINFDWYAPSNCHRHTEEEIRQWCQDAGLEVNREVVEDAGITIVATKL